MPRGVPKAGFRMTKKRLQALGGDITAFKTLHINPKTAGAVGFQVPASHPSFNVPSPQQQFLPEPVRHETDEQIEAKLKERFEILEAMVQAAIDGEARALIVSGPAGLGKSYTVEQRLAEWDANETSHTIVKGYVLATNLYKLLYKHREKGQVIVFDDADRVFGDENSLNFLKAVCDTMDRRRVSYMTEGVLVDDETSQRLPKSFEFHGTIIFITNLDFDNMIARGHRLAPHLQALVSRSHYIDLAMKTKRDHIVRIKQVVRQGLLRKQGLSDDQEREVMAFIEHNVDRLRELSLRMALKIGAIRKSAPINWKSVARVTCCRNA